MAYTPEEAKVARGVRRSILAEWPGLVQHGTPSTYSNWGCRGEYCNNACVVAHTRRWKKWNLYRSVNVARVVWPEGEGK